MIMNTKKYFCDEWELSSIQSSETTLRVRSFIEEVKKFEDVLEVLELPIKDIELIVNDDGVCIHIACNSRDYGLFVREVEVISAYLKAHLPIKNYEDLVRRGFSEETDVSCLKYELDLDSYEFGYPTHDYFYMSFYS